ncbi:MAG: hypothetical protein BWY75_02985 [bacterium ADurb.Bin425]|nr:MAG: hypothetical protein BWY75_02985 [bacterium ADurb.Bin425]
MGFWSIDLKSNDATAFGMLKTLKLHLEKSKVTVSPSFTP